MSFTNKAANQGREDMRPRKQWSQQKGEGNPRTVLNSTPREHLIRPSEKMEDSRKTKLPHNFDSVEKSEESAEMLSQMHKEPDIFLKNYRNY